MRGRPRGRPRSGRGRYALRRPAGRAPAGWPGSRARARKLCPGRTPPVPGTLKVPFPILRRARPQAAVSATSACVTSVTRPLRQVTLPPGLAVPTSGRAVRSASVPSLGGGSAIHRYRWRRPAEPRPTVRRISCGTVPCRCSPNVLRLDGLHTRMRLPPAARTASQGARRAYRSSRERTGRSPIMEDPASAGRRRAAPAVPFAGPVPGGTRTPAPTAVPGFGPAQPTTRRRSRGKTPLHRPHGASGAARNTPNRPMPPACARPDTAFRQHPDSPDPQRSPKTRRRRAPAALRPAFGGCGCRTGCVPCRTASARPGCSDPPKRGRRCDKKDGLRMGNTETQGRYRASHTGRCARTARPAATRTGHPTSPCGVRDIAYQGLNHMSKPMQTP